MPDVPAASAARTPEALLARFHAQVRLAGRDVDEGQVVERDGPVRRSYAVDPAARGAMLECPEGLGDDPDHWIARQRDFFMGRGQPVEWKTYGYDEPDDLGARLEAHGFVPDDEEVLVLGEAAALVHDVELPDGVRVREIESDADWERFRTLMDTVWGPGSAWVIDHFREEQRRGLAGEGGRLIAVVAEESADGPVLCATNLRLTPGSDFCGLWGGSTLPQWRRRGLYRALTAYRARLAIGLGHPLVRVDTSPDSRPILVGLGLHAVTTTRPYLLTP